MKEPVELFEYLASCIDFILTHQPNVVTDSGVHPLLHTNCHHQIVYCSVNLTIRLPTPYGRSIWGYNKAVIEKITIPIEQVYWENNQQVAILIKTIINIFSNFVSNRLLICDDRNPSWINELI